MAPPSRRRSVPARGRSRLTLVGRWLGGIAATGVLTLGYLAVTVPDVRPLVDAPPEDTAFMRLRTRQAHAEGRPDVRDYRFVPYGRIAQTLKRAVLVAEDSGFWDHEGIEIDAIRESLEANLTRGTVVRGGSTITQQLAKNLYLSPSQDPLRKLRELMITHRLERLLSKRRILELYLNVVEWGGGTWGAEAASRRYFRKPASSLAASEAALLAGALINPNRYSPADPPTRLRRRQQIILRRMGMRSAPAPPSEQEPAVAERRPPSSDPAVGTSAADDASGETTGETPTPPTPEPQDPAPTPDEVPPPAPPPVPVP